ncbi:rhodanese-like domain-containing protein [Brevibacterium casei]|nr:rhodanese-like domain-containing protein [Brevibacterium casei]
MTSLDAHRAALAGAPTPEVPVPTDDAEAAAIGWDEVGPQDRLIDIREDAEVSAGAVAGARHIPMEALLADPAKLLGSGDEMKTGRIALYCRSGVRSARRARRAAAASTSSPSPAATSPTSPAPTPRRWPEQAFRLAAGERREHVDGVPVVRASARSRRATALTRNDDRESTVTASAEAPSASTATSSSRVAASTVD